GLLLKLRFAFDHFINLRPSKLFPNTATPLAGPGSPPGPGTGGPAAQAAKYWDSESRSSSSTRSGRV
ncbi:hypothetical protein, partial [Streptomyces parvus]|uniref:hypothetical protein n=1 Tax=Streptomyces parvus TaxID=66428 RepID=UPI0033D9CEF5